MGIEFSTSWREIPYIAMWSVCERALNCCVAVLVYFAGLLRIHDMPYPLMNCPSLLFVRCEITSLWFVYSVESITENLSSLGLACARWLGIGSVDVKHL